MDDLEFAELENQIYEAAIVSTKWDGALEATARLARAGGAVLFTVDSGGVRWTSSPAIRDHFQRFVEEGWLARNSRGEGVIRKGLVGAPRFVTEADYFDIGQAETDPLTNEFLRPLGFGWAAGTVVSLPDGNMFTLSVEQHYDRGPIAGAALARLDAIRPHLTRAAALATELALRELRTGVEMLGAVGLPAAAITEKGKVLVANASFERETHLWMVRAGDRLTPHDRVADSLLTDALGQIHTVLGQRSIPLRNSDDTPVAVLQLLPVRRCVHDLFHLAHAIVVVNRVRDSIDPASVQIMFDLTAAEAAVVAAIGTGLRIEEIAHRNGTSIETVRSQLKTAMNKTGYHRQADLVRVTSTLARTGEYTCFESNPLHPEK